MQYTTKIIALYILCALCACTVPNFADARKKSPVQIPFTSPITDAMMCDVCEMTVVNAYKQVEEIALERAMERQTIYEDDVLGVLEYVCNPFREEGEWIRRIALKIVDLNNLGAEANESASSNESQNKTSAQSSSPTKQKKLSLRPVVLNHFTQCKRTCATVRDLCEQIIDSDEADALPRLLLEYVTQSDEVKVATNNKEYKRDDDGHIGNEAAEISKKVCHIMTSCKRRQELHDVVDEFLENKEHCGSTHNEEMCDIRKIIKNDYPVKTTTKQMEAEELMYKLETEEGRPSEMFLRDEMSALQDAIYRGDREAALEIDGHISELTDEEFNDLRRAMGAFDEAEELES